MYTSQTKTESTQSNAEEENKDEKSSIVDTVSVLNWKPSWEFIKNAFRPHSRRTDTRPTLD